MSPLIHSCLLSIWCKAIKRCRSTECWYHSAIILWTSITPSWETEMLLYGETFPKYLHIVGIKQIITNPDIKAKHAGHNSSIALRIESQLIWKVAENQRQLLKTPMTFRFMKNEEPHHHLWLKHQNASGKKSYFRLCTYICSYNCKVPREWVVV